MKILRIGLSLLLGTLLLIFAAKPALAFCGFYVAQADSSLYNQASQVIIARDRNKTVLTMSNDYQGEVKDFAMVVPVPVVLTEEQVHIADPEIIEWLDAFSAPRLVEYFDPDPCLPETSLATDSVGNLGISKKISGVTIEKQFSVGEYDILILSAKESNGLKTWLTNNGYQLPEEAKDLLQPYIRQNMKFLVAKVNLEEFNNNTFEKLRPISIAYESPKFMLPIRLGMTNAKDEQDLIVYLLSPQGQVELTNYRTVKIPSNVSIPEFVASKFDDFYQAMFTNTHNKEDKKVAFLEYAWDLTTKCDPCIAGVATPQEEQLKQAGVFWIDTSSDNRKSVFITRLHIRYSRDQFPEDLDFQTTSNKKLFQSRYIINHPFPEETEIASCPPIKDFSNWQVIRHRLRIAHQKDRLRLRQQNGERIQKQEQEIQTLVDLTGWDIDEIREEITKPVP